MPRMGLDFSTVVSAAAVLADEKGMDGISLGELAQRLNVRTPSLYNHVDSLEALKQSLAIYGLNRLYEKLQVSADGLLGDAAVYAMSDAYISFARNHPGLYDATFRAPVTSDPELHHAQQQVVGLVAQTLHVYDLQGDHALHTIRGFRSILHGFASIESSGGFGLPLDLDVSFRMLVDTFLAGIHAQVRE
ncbi:TetR/AcrR family transcriptional regulator [Brevibacillus reuszeri]|uniref:TetR/AcrR family transcriptional regulator n=1 Tax=Brevibacillus reuszeri TaxID=54915 RepID=UPI0028968995|nr:WHG domain-containing protein [Brevibacillus reuszeri]